MKATGIKAGHKRRQTLGQLEAPVHAIASNLLYRQFETTRPNQKWTADFTCVWRSEGWLFVAVVLDLYSRRVVGWSMQPTMTAQLVMDALLMAISVADVPVQCCIIRIGVRNTPARFSVATRIPRHRLQHEPSR
jgi:transposase InsO family protein